MAKGRVAKRKPHFVKVLFGDFSQRLRIPPNFVKHFSGECSGRAILEGPTGVMWPVELQRTSKGTFLSGGWHNFVKDNNLQVLELLLFRYEGRMHFGVSVFDTSACERQHLRPGEGSASYARGLRKRGRTRKCPQVFGCHIRAEESGQEQPNSLHNGRCLQLTQLDMEIKIEEDDLPLSAIGLLPSSSTVGSSSDPLTIRRVRDRPMNLTSCSKSQKSRHRNKVRGFLSQRRPVSLEERERASEAAKSFTSDLPFYIACMKISAVYRIFLLKVPTSFAKAHLPCTRTQVVLEDPTGRTWQVRYIPKIESRERYSESRLSGGWAAFARGNNLEEGDFCVFELVRPVELRVHIFRVVEEITPLIKASSMCIV